MIQKNRLEELIKQGAVIYCPYYMYYDGVELDNRDYVDNEFLYIFRQVWEKQSGYDKFQFKYLFETKEDAEEYLEFANIERIEKFPFVPYREFIKPTNIIFKNKDNVEMELAIWFNSESEIDSETIKLTNRNDWNICYFEKPLTQENYHKALRVCRKLFLGD